MATEAALTYYVTYGKGDGSECLEWSAELTEDAEEAYLEAKRLHRSFADYPVLDEVLSAAYGEIVEYETSLMEELEYEESSFDRGLSLSVEFAEDPETEELTEEEAKLIIREFFDKKDCSGLVKFIDRCEDYCSDSLLSIAMEVVSENEEE